MAERILSLRVMGILFGALSLRWLNTSYNNTGMSVRAFRDQWVECQHLTDVETEAWSYPGSASGLRLLSKMAMQLWLK